MEFSFNIIDTQIDFHLFSQHYAKIYATDNFSTYAMHDIVLVVSFLYAISCPLVRICRRVWLAANALKWHARVCLTCFILGCETNIVLLLLYFQKFFRPYASHSHLCGLAIWCCIVRWHIILNVIFGNGCAFTIQAYSHCHCHCMHTMPVWLMLSLLPLLSLSLVLLPLLFDARLYKKLMLATTCDKARF